MNPGRLDTRVTFRREPITAGNGRGAFADFFSAWAEWRPLTGRKAAEGGLVEDQIEGTLVIRASAKARELTNAERVILKGQDLAIQAVSIPDRSGFLEIRVKRTIGG